MSGVFGKRALSRRARLCCLSMSKLFPRKELRIRTWRVRRTLLDRLLRGYTQAYQTQITDGFREAHGKGPTRQESRDAAERIWEARFGEQAEREER